MRSLPCLITEKALWQRDDSDDQQARGNLSARSPKAAPQPGRRNRADQQLAPGARNHHANESTSPSILSRNSSPDKLFDNNDVCTTRLCKYPCARATPTQLLLGFSTAQGFCTIPRIPLLHTFLPIASERAGRSAGRTKMPSLKG